MNLFSSWSYIFRGIAPYIIGFQSDDVDYDDIPDDDHDYHNHYGYGDANDDKDYGGESSLLAMMVISYSWFDFKPEYFPECSSD